MPEVPLQSTPSPLAGDHHRDGDVTERPAFRDGARVVALAVSGAP
ncbi:hypothetical protein AB0I91_39205 [Actinosynnema sp. NPDC049800]